MLVFIIKATMPSETFTMILKGRISHLDPDLRREIETIITRTVRYSNYAVPISFLALRNVFMHDGRQLSSLHALRVGLKRWCLVRDGNHFHARPNCKIFVPRARNPVYVVYGLGKRKGNVGIEFALRVHQNLVNSSRSAKLRSNNKAHASLSNNHRDYIFIKDRRDISTSLLSRLRKYPL